MRALELTTVGALVRVCCNKRIMSAPVVAAGFGDFVLLNSHCLGPFIIRGLLRRAENAGAAVFRIHVPYRV